MVHQKHKLTIFGSFELSPKNKQTMEVKLMLEIIIEQKYNINNYI